MDVFNLAAKFEQVDEYWSPHIVAELNGQYLKVAKLKGEFVWHKHEREDELFYVIKGELDIAFEDGIKRLKAGDCLCVPKGVEHKPVADEEVWVVLFEPKETLNTGNVEDQKTKRNLKRI